MNPRLSLLSASEIQRICQTSRRILEHKGLRFTVPEVLDVFRRHGFEIRDGNVVHIRGDQLDAALKTAPRSFVRRGAVPARDVPIGDHQTKFAVGSLPIWIIEEEPALRRRPATLDDFKRFTLLSEALDGYQIGNPVVQPQEISNHVMHVLWNRNNAVRMTKPACCWYGNNREEAREGLEVLRLAAGGLENLRRLKRWAITICPDSAMQWGSSSIGALVMAEAEVPLDILPMPFLGSMYPVTLAGALVQSAAETLGIVVLAQLVRPGCPVLYAPSYGGIMDMSTASHSFGAPESALFAACSTEIGRAFGLPTNMMQGATDSKRPDAQAASEKMMTYLLCAMAGADCVTQAGSLLDFALSASYEMLVMEDEMIRSVRRILRGSLINDETLAESEIMSLPFGGHYLESEHTFKHFRDELMDVRLADRHAWEPWVQAGASTMTVRARSRCTDILSSAKPCQGIADDEMRAVDRFVAEVCRRHNVDPEPLLY